MDLLWPLVFLILVAIFVIFLFIDCDWTLFYCARFGNRISSLRGKVVWITGGSDGIGAGLARELAKVGAKLALSGTSPEKLESVKKECLMSGPLTDDDILLLPFNLTNYDVHQECTDTVINHFGRIDILVNNAGRSQRAAFGDIQLAVDKEMFELNVFASLNLTRVVLPYFLKKGKGHFVVTTSTAGKFGVPGSASYTATKHALHGYFECLRTEICRNGIDITMVVPGPVFSGFLERAFTGQAGKVHGVKQHLNERRMQTDRCAYLYAVAIANKLDEAWISIQPILLIYYVAQYAPSLFRRFIIPRMFSPELAAKLREGKW